MSALLNFALDNWQVVAGGIAAIGTVLGAWLKQRSDVARGKAEAQRDQAQASAEHQAAGGEHARDHAALDRDELVRRAREQAGRD